MWTTSKNLLRVVLCLGLVIFSAVPALGAPGSTFTLTVRENEVSPLVKVTCYVFDEGGNYLGLKAATNTSGTVSFKLADGTYRFQVDRLGYRFWSDLYLVPATLSAVMTIPHQEVVITVRGAGHESPPLPGLKVYLFTEAGLYLGQSLVTDSDGQVRFNLPGQPYKVRVDYLDKQYWSEVFVSQDITVNIPTAGAEVTVMGSGAPLSGVKVRVFVGTEPYLGIVGTTDADGKVLFTLAAGGYRFRADYKGIRYWSDETTLVAGQVTPVVISTAPQAIQVPDVLGLSQAEAEAAITAAGLALGVTTEEYSNTVPSGLVVSQNPPGGTTVQQGSAVDLVMSLGPIPGPTAIITASPQTIDPGGSVILSWVSTGADSCTVEPGIGSVGPNGSLEVTPVATTLYIFTAVGPGGTATDSVEVRVMSAFELESFGMEPDEQEGGAGLVAGSIRILNGNAIEFRPDLDIPSPNRLGLSLVAVYNSRYERVGSMGHGWTHTYEASLDPTFVIEGAPTVKIVDGDARTLYFQEGTAGEFSGLFGEGSRIKAEAGGYVWHRLDGSAYSFSFSGRLVRMEDAAGNRLDLAYGFDNRVEKVTDAATGRSLTFHYSGGRLDRVTGPVTAAVPDGVWVNYGYDGNQNLTRVTYADGSGFAYLYNDGNDAHNLTQKKDLLNRVLREWSYNANDQATACLNPDGKGVTSVTYGDTHVEVRDVYDVLRTYTLEKIDGRRKVTLMTGIPNAPYGESNAVRWVYDEKARLREVEYGGGRIDLYQDYDDRGNAATVILASGSVDQRMIQYTYHPQMNVPLTRSEPSLLQGGGSKVTIWDYDGDYDATPNESPTGLLSRLIERGYTADLSGTVFPYEYATTFTYNGRGQVLSIDGPRPGAGDTTSFTYSAGEGDLQSITRPHIGTTHFGEYDGAGRPGRVTDVNNRAEGFSYDGRGRITAVAHYADNPSSTTRFTYAGGLPDSITDPDGVVQFFDYDAQYGRLATITDGDGNTISHAYEAYPRGNLIERGKYTSTQQRTSRKRWSHEHPQYPGKLYREIQADGTYREYWYDDAGDVSSLIDPNGNLTTYAYDFMDRPVSVAQTVNAPNPGEVVTDYAYDGQGNLITVMDAEGQTTSYAYDDMGRLITASSPDTGATLYAYDEAGNLRFKRDANGVTVEYRYDNLNRITAALHPDPIDNITYVYDQGADGRGRLTTMVDPSGTMSFSYDQRGRLVGKTSTIDGVSYAVTYVFTPGGRVESMTHPGGRSVTNARDTLGKIWGVSASGFGVLASHLNYRPFGGPVGMSTGNWGTVNNEAGECDCVTVSNPGQQRERIYGYDPNRNLTSIMGTYTPWYSQTFEYDDLNRLIAATGRYGTIFYSYDDVGNRAGKSANSVDETYSYYAGTNSLYRIDGGDHPRTFGYDENGNITGDGLLSFVYDQRNQLVEVRRATEAIAEYTYNGLGQRVVKKTGGETTVYHYDLEGKLIGESMPDGTFVKEYLYMGKVRIAMVEAGPEGESLYHYLNDRLGTPEILADAEGTVVWEAWYEPFGEAHIHPSSRVVNNMRFPGQYFDQETGLHYNYHRYYDPKTGRYLTPDPLNLETIQISRQKPETSLFAYQYYKLCLGNPGLLNAYAYVENNPVNDSDLYGLFVGTLMRPIIRLFGTGAQEAKVAANIGDALTSAGITAGVIQDPGQKVIEYIPGGKTAFETALSYAQIWGGGQTVAISSGLVLTGGSIISTGGLALAGWGGWEIGQGINRLWEAYSGQPLGADIYDWLNGNACD